jgi:hypothetical protein
MKSAIIGFVALLGVSSAAAQGRPTRQLCDGRGTAADREDCVQARLDNACLKRSIVAHESSSDIR